MRLELPMRATLAGRYRMTATNVKTGKTRVVADWFPNLITDWGLNAKGDTSSFLAQYFHVGSGSTAPQVTDTTLETWVASTNTTQSSSVGAQSSSPYYGWYRLTKRFAEGVAAGNLSEVGVGPAGGASDNLFSRALILDSGGSPTTITVLADEILDVTYEIRLYPPTTDWTGTITDGGDSYDVTVRAAVVTDSAYWGGSEILNAAEPVYGVVGSDRRAFSGAIGSITGSPSGTDSSSSSATNDAYSNNSLERTGSIFWGLDDGNVGGIQSIFWRTRGRIGAFQAGFSPAIAKDNTKELTIGVKVSWGRASI